MNDIDILLDIYRDDPETAIAMAQQDSLLSDLFLGQVSHLESGASEIGWNYLIMMVLGLPGHYRHNAFKRLLQLSQQFQAQPELLEELVAARENSQVIDRHENMFAPLFINMKKSELELITSWPLALHV